MDEYTIYCTSEQVEKALELGAQIKYANAYNAYLPHTMIDFVGESGKMECAQFVIPSAEQMIGWIESFPQIHHISVWKECVRWNYTFYYKQDGIVKRFDIGSSGNRPEATLAAIDAALKYLENLKQ